MISDGTLLMIGCAIAASLSALVARRLGRRKSHWSRRKIALTAALPLPAVISLIPAYLLLHTWMTGIYSPHNCGVDACGMAMFAALIMLAGLMVVFFVSVLIAWLAQAKSRA